MVQKGFCTTSPAARITQKRANDSEILSDCAFTLDWFEILISGPGLKDPAPILQATSFDDGLETMVSDQTLDLTPSRKISRGSKTALALTTWRDCCDSSPQPAVDPWSNKFNSIPILLKPGPSCNGSSEPPSWLAAGMTAQMLAARVLDGAQEMQVNAAASEDAEASFRPFSSDDGSIQPDVADQPSWQAAGLGGTPLSESLPSIPQGVAIRPSAYPAIQPRCEVAIPAPPQSTTGHGSPQLHLKCPLNRHLNRLLSREDSDGFESPESLRFNDGCNSMTTMEVPDSMDLGMRLPRSCKFSPGQLPGHFACAVQNPIKPFFLYNKSNKRLLSSAEPGDALYQFETAVYGHFNRHPWSLSDAYEQNHRDCFPVASRYPVSFKTWRSNILRELAVIRSQVSKKVRTKYVPLCVDTLWQCVRFGFVGVDPVGAIQWVSYPAGEQDNASWFLEAYSVCSPFQTARNNSLNGKPMKETMAMGIHSETWMARQAIEKRSRVGHKWNGPPPRVPVVHCQYERYMDWDGCGRGRIICERDHAVYTNATVDEDNDEVGNTAKFELNPARWVGVTVPKRFTEEEWDAILFRKQERPAVGGIFERTCDAVSAAMKWLVTPRPMWIYE
ncbi:hypothetical protein BJ741DRAFT_703807 [Chytriomyces cf. hyalinus JEL632]|nr:hypothetical protein BJ741DRAFT_703807 [Chytriomyces cf. hyalinus JEL632]